MIITSVLECSVQSVITQVFAECSSGYTVGKTSAIFWMTMAHYSSCHPSSLPRPHPFRAPIFFPFYLLFYLLLHLSHAPFFKTSFLLLFSVLALCLKAAHLPQCPKQHSSLSLSLLCSIPPSIHPSIHHPPTTTLSISLLLISLPMLWLVSPISFRTVITAVSSLGENKVILCSWHHKRQERNKRKEP